MKDNMHFYRTSFSLTFPLPHLILKSNDLRNGGNILCQNLQPTDDRRSIWKRIVAFAIPLFWGNLFQQLYNTADSLIVGNFLGALRLPLSVLPVI